MRIAEVCLMFDVRTVLCALDYGQMKIDAHFDEAMPCEEIGSFHIS